MHGIFEMRAEPNQNRRQSCEARRRRSSRLEVLPKDVGRPKSNKEREQNKSGGKRILASPVHGLA